MVLIVHHIIVSFIGIIMGILDSVFSRTKGNSKYYAWVMLMVLFLVPLAGINHQAIINLNIGTVTTEPVNSIVGIVGEAGIDVTDEAIASVTISHFIMIIWVSGIFFITIIAIVNQFRLKEYISRCGKNISENEISKIFIGKEFERNDFNKLKFVKVPMFKSPALIGIFKPIVLMPEGMNYTDDETELVIMHECYHYKRKDNIIKFVINLVAVLFWFNPLIHLFKKTTLRYCELTCDEYILSMENKKNKLCYFNALVKTVTYDMKYKNSFASHFILGDNKIFKERIENITMDKQEKKGTKLIVMVVSMILAMNVLVGCNTTTNGNETKISETENIEMSLSDKEEEDAVEEVVIDYNSVDSFEYTHIISYDSWDEAKRDYKESIYYQNDFNGNVFGGLLKCTEANRVGKSDVFDVSFVGILERKSK